MDNRKLAREVLELVGGEENIVRLTHCFTRLRFVLRDDSLADIKKIDKLEGVLKCQNKGGQIQVVLGAKVAAVYKEVCEMTDIDTSDGADDAGVSENKNFFQRFLQIIVGIFTPMIPAMAGTGLIKGLVVILTTTGLADASSGFITILTMIGDCVFYFIPFFLAVTAAKVFKVKEAYALVMAAGLMHPTILNAAPGIRTGEVLTMDFLGLPLLLYKYSNSVFPIILAVWILSYVYRYVDKIVPGFLKPILTPILVFMIMIPLELIAIAPIGAYMGTFISSGINGFFAVGGVFAGLVLGFFRPILVMFGMHYSLIPIQIQQIGSQGFTLLMPSALAANFAQGGAALGVFLAAKNKGTKSVALSSSATAVFGITEPALYGVNLKYKKPFLAACISAGLVSGFFVLVNAKTVALGLPGLLSLANNEADRFIYIIIGVVAAFGLAALFTVLMGIEEETEESQSKEAVTGESVVGQAVALNEGISIIAPINGKVVDLSVLEDKAFAQGHLGKGVAIIPAEGKVHAPFDCTVAAVLKSKHALGLKDENGVEMLIHVGMDTVNLKGQYFTSHVEQDQKVKAGDLLLEFDMEAIKAAGYDLVTPVIVTNSDNYLDVVPSVEGNIIGRKELMKVFV